MKIIKGLFKTEIEITEKEIFFLLSDLDINLKKFFLELFKK